MGWTVIVVINLFTTDIRDFLSSLPGIVFISQFVPNLILAFINALVPFMTKKITVCERYDFQADLLKQQIWRNFLTRLLNVAIYFILNTEMMTNQTWFRSSSIIEFNSSTFDCREDQASSNFVLLAFIEVAVKVILAFIWPVIGFILNGLIRGRENWKYP